MILIRKDIPHANIDLTDYTTETEEYAGVRLAALKGATKLVSVCIDRPNPDLRYLELRAQRRRAQRRAQQRPSPENVQAY
ncbi:unnamed protein product, partial [Ixodes hexagonus]